MGKEHGRKEVQEIRNRLVGLGVIQEKGTRLICLPLNVFEWMLTRHQKESGELFIGRLTFDDKLKTVSMRLFEGEFYKYLADYWKVLTDMLSLVRSYGLYLENVQEIVSLSGRGIYG